jgi:hypothetical protein
MRFFECYSANPLFLPARTVFAPFNLTPPVTLYFHPLLWIAYRMLDPLTDADLSSAILSSNYARMPVFHRRI